MIDVMRSYRHRSAHDHCVWYDSSIHTRRASHSLGIDIIWNRLKDDLTLFNRDR
jgi:hypothetical protein